MTALAVPSPERPLALIVSPPTTAASLVMERLGDTHAWPRLLVLLSAGGSTAMADLLEADPYGDPADAVHTSLCDALEDGTTEVHALGGNLFALLAPAGARAGAVIATARAALAARSEQLAAASVYGEVLIPEEAATPEDAVARAVERMRSRACWLELSGARDIRDALLRLLDEAGVAADVDRAQVTANAVAVARSLGLSLPDIEVLVRAAELQDLGKISIPDSILSKAQALDPEEWALVRRHPVVGERILAASGAMAPVARLVRSCYERWDGTGYPDGLSGDQIPIGARIIAVCVAYSAMTSPRPYRPPLMPQDALAELRAAAGTQFDPMVVEAFRAEMEPAESMPQFLVHHRS